MVYPELKKLTDLHNYAYSDSVQTLPIGGIYRYRNGGETHAYEGKLIHLLQTAVADDSMRCLKYSNSMSNFAPINIRDLLEFKESESSIELSEVESITSIRKRFGTGSMSHGALSKEAHETLAIAMNRIEVLLVQAKAVNRLKDRSLSIMETVLTQE